MRLHILTAALAALFALPALAADGILITDPYARISPSGSGAVFMVIENHAAAEDRLVSAAADVAERVELHTHVTDGNGVMQMIHVTDGLPVPANGTRALHRGGDHVMLMGLTRALTEGDSFDLTLTFAGGTVVTVPVDNARKPGGHAHGQGTPSN
jgi:copper(I)-binding protein